MAGIVEKTKQKVISKATSKAAGKAADYIDKLAGKKKKDGNNVEKITFPTNLENQAQSTYMVIYIFDNNNNSSKFSTNVFKSNGDESTYEIKAVTYIKDQIKKEVLDPIKDWAKETKKEIVKTAKDWLKSEKDKKEKDDKKEDKTEALSVVQDVKEAYSWVNEWLVPHRKKKGSKALDDKFDPAKNGMVGYKLIKAVQIQMPSSSLTYKYENGWESTDTSTLNTIKTLIEGVKNLFGDDEKNKTGKDQLKNVLTQVTNKVEDVVTGGGATATNQARSRQVYNPVLVFNYTVPTPRTFSYSFQLYPRNKEELYTLFNMIQTLKFYALPEVGSGEIKNSETRPIFFNYPAKFSVKFYTNGYENKWFPKTMALGLTSIEETLTGDNGDLAFFENYFDTQTGNPPRLVNLTLTFKELGIMSREYAQLGY